MIVKYNDEGTPKRDAKIAAILPKKTIISEVLEPLIEKHLFEPLAKCVRMELDVYRAYPRTTRKALRKKMIATFDPTNNETCFMGKGFKGNDDLTDFELAKYRKAIGTVPHDVWGNSTLLEIWGGDHFADHPDMVIGAFEYGMGLRDDCPEIRFYVNPLFKNQLSKEFRLSKEQQEEKDYMDELMARALVYGVKDAKTAWKDRQR